MLTHALSAPDLQLANAHVANALVARKQAIKMLAAAHIAHKGALCYPSRDQFKRFCSAQAARNEPCISYKRALYQPQKSPVILRKRSARSRCSAPHLRSLIPSLRPFFSCRAHLNRTLPAPSAMLHYSQAFVVSAIFACHYFLRAMFGCHYFSLFARICSECSHL